MSNFSTILEDVIEYSGLVNRKDFVIRLIIATLNDLHLSRKWMKDTSSSGWSYAKAKADAEASGLCPPKPPTELTFNIGSDSKLLSVIVCDFEGNGVELFPTDSSSGIEDICNPPICSTDAYILEELGSVFTVKGARPIATIKVNTKSEVQYTIDNFDSSWIVQRYPNTIIYLVTADLLEDVGMHNSDQWRIKSNHATSHMHATEEHYA